MKMQKEIQAKLGALKTLIEDRQKVSFQCYDVMTVSMTFHLQILIAKVKRMEETKLCEIQNASRNSLFLTF